MKKNLLVFILALLVGLGVGVYMMGGLSSHGDGGNGEFSAGEHYLVLDKPLSVDKGSFVTISSYACPFCYKYYQNVLPEILGEISATYEPFHMHAMGEFGVSVSKILAVARVLDKRENIAPNSPNSKFKKILFAYFESYHDKKERPSADMDEMKFLQTGFTAGGITREIYESELQNSEVLDLLGLWDEGYDVALIQGVPAFVVSGKYLIKTEKIASTAEFAKLIDYLASKNE
ncbi:MULTISPECIES: thiol:disulfide interchange protein [unclassified Campylobacter]|uniref:thiol:disulfide interchange protein n=1 Tax=unclassified Campylobacter TaxID=2593542 RepID=UPI0022E9EF19|nr:MULTISPECIES: thiol:disulfide interchange protein [unclassified Campylobacter]MDA3062676.1 thiol:disulfide interchange protein [Campylobacter sp. JMF_14 EL1]MDA3074023.1 thiol:disulfide interchange protein [Campylobacter sp. JMF_10 EL2]